MPAARLRIRLGVWWAFDELPPAEISVSTPGQRVRRCCCGWRVTACSAESWVVCVGGREHGGTETTDPSLALVFRFAPSPNMDTSMSTAEPFVFALFRDLGTPELFYPDKATACQESAYIARYALTPGKGGIVVLGNGQWLGKLMCRGFGVCGMG